MPHLEIKLLSGKTEAQKELLANEVMKAAQRVIGYGDESYSVAITDCSLQEWKDEVYPNDVMGDISKLYKVPGYEM